MQNYGYDSFIRISVSTSAALRKFSVSVQLPPYITIYGNYTIRYLQLIIDDTALIVDYNKYQFTTITIYAASSFSFNVGKDISLLNMNTFYGISQYYFYNCQ